MKNLIPTVAIPLLLIAVAFSIFVKQVVAQDTGLGLSISPPVQYIEALPGQSITHTIIVENTSAFPVTISPKLVDFETEKITGRVQLQDTLTFPYLTQNPNQLWKPTELAAGEKYTFSVPMSIPDDATEQEYHLTFIAGAQSVSSVELDSATQTSVTGNIASNIIVTISPLQQNRSKLSLFKLKGPRVVDSLRPISFQYVAKNTGSTATPASGSATLKNGFGSTLLRAEVWPDVILAQSERLLRFFPKNQESTELSTATPEETFRYSAPFLIGTYELEVRLYSPFLPENEVTTNETIIALPISILVVTFVIALLGVLYWLSARKLPLV
ncbi:MAG: hypothetical protein M3Q81_02005 [bacterium]|nr:hypothetical protein [bacterium]